MGKIATKKFSAYSIKKITQVEGKDGANGSSKLRRLVNRQALYGHKACPFFPSGSCILDFVEIVLFCFYETNLN